MRLCSIWLLLFVVETTKAYFSPDVLPVAKIVVDSLEKFAKNDIARQIQPIKKVCDVIAMCTKTSKFLIEYYEGFSKPEGKETKKAGT